MAKSCAVFECAPNPTNADEDGLGRARPHLWAGAACRETTARATRPALYLSDALRTFHALSVAQRQRDKAGGAVDLHAHQDVVLALGLGGLQRFDDVARVADRLAADVENNGADLEAGIGGGTVRLDRGDDHALAAGTGDRRSRRHAQAEMRHAVLRRRHLLPGIGPSLVRHGAERHRDGLRLAVTQDVELHRAV